MSKLVFYFVIVVALLPQLSGCSSLDGTRLHPDSNYQFIQLADGWHSFDLPSAYLSGYEPASSLEMNGEIRLNLDDRLELGPHGMIGPFTTLVSAKISRQADEFCHASQQNISQAWMLNLRREASRGGRLEPIEGASIHCQGWRSIEPNRSLFKLPGDNIVQYIGVHPEGRFVYLTCSENTYSNGDSGCLLETAWKSANLSINFRKEYEDRWVEILDLVDARFVKAHVAVHSHHKIEAGDLDVNMVVDDVSFRVSPQFVDIVRPVGSKNFATKRQVVLKFRFSSSDKSLRPVKGGHDSSYRSLEIGNGDVSITFNSPHLFKEWGFGSVREDLSDWSTAPGGFEDIELAPKKASGFTEVDGSPDHFNYAVLRSSRQIGLLKCRDPQKSKTTMIGNCDHVIMRDGIPLKIVTLFVQEIELTDVYQAIDEALSQFYNSSRR